jgi:hypothetical protein
MDIITTGTLIGIVVIGIMAIDTMGGSDLRGKDPRDRDQGSGDQDHYRDRVDKPYQAKNSGLGYRE